MVCVAHADALADCMKGFLGGIGGKAIGAQFLNVVTIALLLVIIVSSASFSEIWCC